MTAVFKNAAINNMPKQFIKTFCNLNNITQVKNNDNIRRVLCQNVSKTFSSKNLQSACMQQLSGRPMDTHAKKEKEKKKKKERGPCGACNMLFEIACSWIVSSAKTEAVPYWWQNITPT